MGEDLHVKPGQRIRAGHHNGLLDMLSRILPQRPGPQLEQRHSASGIHTTLNLPERDPEMTPLPDAPRKALALTIGALDADSWSIEDAADPLHANHGKGVEIKLQTKPRMNYTTLYWEITYRTLKFDPGGRLVAVTEETEWLNAEEAARCGVCVAS